MYGFLSDANGLAEAKAVGSRWIRTSLSWSSVEPEDTSPENYNWSAFDASLANARAKGMNLLVTVESNPWWAASSGCGPINEDRLGDFAEFLQAAVERYDGDGIEDAPGSLEVHYWELYNEPDSKYCWGYYGDKYAQMLATVYPAMKAADPEVKVLLGGLAYDWFEDWPNPGHCVRRFLDDVLTAGGGDFFDLMNFHYYPLFSWESYGPGMMGKVNYLRNKLAEYGVDKPFVCTETGWHSNWVSAAPSSYEDQSRYVVKLLTWGLASEQQIVVWFTLIDPGGAYGLDDGLLDQNLNRKPSFYAYQTAVEMLGQVEYQRALAEEELGSSNLEGYKFIRFPQSASRLLWVVWANDDETHQVRVPATLVRQVDKYGSEKVLQDRDDGHEDKQVLVAVGPSPIYIEIWQ